jgi:hypothetical protein
MTKKIEPLSNWITANYAASLLSAKMGFPVQPRYIRSLAKRKRKPVRTQSLGYHQLYSRSDVLASDVKQKAKKSTLDR